MTAPLGPERELEVRRRIWRVEGRARHTQPEAVGERVVHVHANDHHGTSDEHLAPGNGTVPWETIGINLRSLGFTGWLILELNRALSSSPAELVRAREQLVSRLG